MIPLFSLHQYLRSNQWLSPLHSHQFNQLIILMHFHLLDLLLSPQYSPCLDQRFSLPFNQSQNPPVNLHLNRQCNHQPNQRLGPVENRAENPPLNRPNSQLNNLTVSLLHILLENRACNHQVSPAFSLRHSQVYNRIPVLRCNR